MAPTARRFAPKSRSSCASQPPESMWNLYGIHRESTGNPCVTLHTKVFCFGGTSSLLETFHWTLGQVRNDGSQIWVISPWTRTELRFWAKSSSRQRMPQVASRLGLGLTHLQFTSITTWKAKAPSPTAQHGCQQLCTGPTWVTINIQ